MKIAVSLFNGGVFGCMGDFEAKRSLRVSTNGDIFSFVLLL
jgi:hypothetical protein